MSDETTTWLTTPEAGWSEADIPFTVVEDSFVSGDKSGFRIRTRYYRREEDGFLMAKAHFGLGTQGPPGHAHGGSMASLLDEVMGAAAWMHGHPVVAVELVTRFKQMLPIGSRVIGEGWIDRVDGRKVFTRGRLRGLDGETLHAEGEAVFVHLSDEIFKDFEARVSQTLRR